MPLAAWRPWASCRPSWLGTYSRSVAARTTRARVAGATLSESRRARDTVAIDTPARVATSRIVVATRSRLPSPDRCNRFQQPFSSPWQTTRSAVLTPGDGSGKRRRSAHQSRPHERDRARPGREPHPLVDAHRHRIALVAARTHQAGRRTRVSGGRQPGKAGGTGQAATAVLGRAADRLDQRDAGRLVEPDRRGGDHATRAVDRDPVEIGSVRR